MIVPSIYYPKISIWIPKLLEIVRVRLPPVELGLSYGNTNPNRFQPRISGNGMSVMSAVVSS